MYTVFLPGLLCDEHIWATQATALSAVTASSIADLTQDDSVAAMASCTLVDAPPRFVLVALSMGGYVAFEILRQAPERVAALALFDTSAAPDSVARAEKRRAGLASLKVGRFAGVTNRLLPNLIHPSLVSGPIGEDLKAMAARVGGEAFARQQQAILNRPDSRPLLPTLSMPTLVVVGDSDVLTPPTDALEIHLGIRTSEFLVLRDCGHLPPLEKPEATTEVLRGFIAKTKASLS